MKNVFLFACGLFFFSACGSDNTSKKIEGEDEIEKLPVDALIKRSVESQLQIPSTEKFTIQIEKANFDGDGIDDAIVLVNRAEFAHSEAITKNNVKYMTDIHYTGNYNYLFYFDGGKEVLSKPIAITSNADIPLKFQIQSIQSEAYMDFTLDYRIMGTCYRNFYTVQNGVPRLVFQWNVFDREKDDEVQINYFQFKLGSQSLAKDILIFPGKFDKPAPSNIHADFDYQISQNGPLNMIFFYLPKEGKYFTNKK